MGRDFYPTFHKRDGHEATLRIAGGVTLTTIGAPEPISR